ncbi:TylF/MycF/NovP-related O-methyltransferase [Arenimonas malthae]|uniref:TylF/MycF/NovP-related O-methyltransferase n=1 Tax=Arenimonas malthae TaxID=354197 RepID=UPI0009FF7FD8|nr:TylF/MycF/NovP-related O-methyltransferase [Arenimonas malthae]
MLGYIRSVRDALRASKLSDIPPWQRAVLAEVKPYTMAGVARTLSTISVVEYIVKQGIQGAVVECGVWRGGQMMAAALSLLELKAERDIFLFDTFSGMTEPGVSDLDHSGAPAAPVYMDSLGRPIGSRWCEAGIDDVRRNLNSTGYPSSRIHYVQGDVEETIPRAAPEQIAYLRLDTDWYSSTAHELEHLFPRVSQHGVVTIDDYGHWLGARQATDEYLAKNRVRAMMHRIDYSARQFVKV